MGTRHPCFSREASGHCGRMHLPVAPRCNIHCGFCDRRFSCVNESRPGVVAKVASPLEALGLARRAVERMPQISVAGIAGPGDPLANPVETLETLRLIREALPHLLLCLSTNGLNLPQYAKELAEIGLGHITVTVNAVDPEIGQKVYRKVMGPNGPLSGRAGAELLLERQKEGIAQVKRLGLAIKINMVIVPGVNDFHAPEVARAMAGLGADLMNCLPLAPVPGTHLAAHGEPGPKSMAEIRAVAEEWLPQMRHCGRCRADAAGLIGQNFMLSEIGREPTSKSRQPQA